MVEAGSARAGRRSDVAARKAELRLLDLPGNEFPNVLAFAHQISHLDLDHSRDVATDITVKGVTAVLAAEADR